MLFDEEGEIRKYLGYRHVTGIKAWKALEKARYIQSLLPSLDSSYSFDKKCAELAKQIGSRRDYVKRQLVGISIYDRIEEDSFFKIPDLDDTTFHFVNLTDSLNRPNIAKFFNVDFNKENPLEKLSYKNVKDWTHWLFEKNTENTTRLRGTSNNLSKLDKIVANKEALDAFRQGVPLKKALEYTEDLADMFHDSVFKSSEYLAQADQVVHKVDKKEFKDSVNEELRNIVRLCKKIRMAIEDVEDEF